jgi:hypothetical protein
MTNILVVLKRNENRLSTTITTTITTGTTTITTTSNTTSATDSNTNTTSFTVAIHLVLAHREQISAVSSRSSCVALLSFLGKGWGRCH